MQQIMQEELEAGKLVGMIPSLPMSNVFLVMGALPPSATVASVMGCYGVTTRRGNNTGRKEGRESGTPPPASSTSRQQVEHQPLVDEAGNVVQEAQHWWLQDKSEGAPEIPYTWDTQAEVDMGSPGPQHQEVPEESPELERRDASSSSWQDLASASSPRNRYHSSKARWTSEDRRAFHQEAAELQSHRPVTSGAEEV